LAVGSPGTPDGGMSSSGAVGVMYGSASGLQPMSQWMLLSDPGMPGSPQNGAEMGWTLATADFTGDRYDDLAIAAPWYNTTNDHGLVFLVSGSSTGLVEAHVRTISRVTSGMPPTEGFSAFGHWLAVGQGSADTYPDLAIGVPGETVSGFVNAGA